MKRLILFTVVAGALYTGALVALLPDVAIPTDPETPMWPSDSEPCPNRQLGMVANLAPATTYTVTINRVDLGIAWVRLLSGPDDVTVWLTNSTTVSVGFQRPSSARVYFEVCEANYTPVVAQPDPVPCFLFSGQQITDPVLCADPTRTRR